MLAKRAQVIYRTGAKVLKYKVKQKYKPKVSWYLHIWKIMEYRINKCLHRVV